MRRRTKKLVDDMDIGWYLVRVDEFDRASALPITRPEVAAFMKDIIGRKK